MGRPFFILWIDAHPDCHTIDTSISGNLLQIPMGYSRTGHYIDPESSLPDK
jgi:arginase